MGDERIDLPQPPLELARQTYLTVDEAAQYLCFPSRNAFYHWIGRSGVPRCRRGRVLLFLRRDLDEAVQPPRPAILSRHREGA